MRPRRATTKRATPPERASHAATFDLHPRLYEDLFLRRRTERRPARRQSDSRSCKDADPQFEAVGYGGPEMAAAGCRVAHRPDGAGRHVVSARAGEHPQVSGVGRPSRSLLSPSSPGCRRADRLSGLQLVDRPAGQGARHSGVLLRAAADLGLGQWRIRKMRRYVDHVLCALPFEARWFAERGCNATFVGHPFFDEVRRQQLDERFMASTATPSGRW